MEKVEEREVKLKYHEFYCDGCGDYLGTSVEWENEHYRNPYKFDTLYINTGNLFGRSANFELDGVFCEKCRDKKFNWLKGQLKKIGFKEYKRQI